MSVSIQQVEQLISQGRYLEARNHAEDGLSSPEHALRFKQLYALALSKSGVPQTAADFFAPIYQMHQSDPESSGILGGIYKELFKQNQDSKYAILSRDIYQANFEQTKNYYTGINAATMSAIAGKMQKGREIAAEIITRINEESTDFWELATLAEAYMLTKNRAKSVELYIKCKQLASTDWGKINSVFNQLWLLNHYVSVPSEILKIFSPPDVVAFVGHMIDSPGRTVPRFPSYIESDIKRELNYAIKSLNAKIGYTSLACGADIIFAETMIENGAELNIYLPFDKNDFVGISVAFAGEQWVSRFNEIVSNRKVKFLTKDQHKGNDELFSLQSKVISGQAILRSKLLHAKASLLTVLSEIDMKTKTGGTRETVQLWPYKDNVHNINPDKYIQSKEIIQVELEQSQPLNLEAKFVADNASVSFLSMITLKHISKEEIQKMWTELNEELLDLNLTVNAFNISENNFLIAFNSIHACVDFTFELLKKYKLHNTKISFHAGPVEITNKENDKSALISGSSVKIVEAVNTYGLSQKAIATDLFASVLSLYVDLYQLTHAGIVSVSESQDKFEIYQIETR